jgi:hypothetical protein
MSRSSFWAPRVLEKKKVLFFRVFNECLFFNFTTPHTDFDIKHDMKWMERKKKGKEMKNMSASL